MMLRRKVSEVATKGGARPLPRVWPRRRLTLMIPISTEPLDLWYYRVPTARRGHNAH